MSCPTCKSQIEINQNTSDLIAEELAPLISLKERIEREALTKAQEQGILGDARL